MVATDNKYIGIDNHGNPIVAGTRFGVEQLATEMLTNGITPEQLCKRHRHELTLAQVYAALSYHYDHLDNSVMRKDQILNTIGKHKAELRKFGVKRLGIFGSCVRNEADQASDLDVLVDLKVKNLRSLVGVKTLLERVFKRKVDVVIADSLRKELREPVLKEVAYVEGI